MATASAVTEVTTPKRPPLIPTAGYGWVKWVVPLALGLGLRIIPGPSGLTPKAWHFFALFAAVIAALVTEPLPGAAVGLIGVTIAACVLGRQYAGRGHEVGALRFFQRHRLAHLRRQHFRPRL